MNVHVGVSFGSKQCRETLRSKQYFECQIGLSHRWEGARLLAICRTKAQRLSAEKVQRVSHRALAATSQIARSTSLHRQAELPSTAAPPSPLENRQYPVDRFQE